MKDEEKIILDLCGGTGSWSAPYAERGYDVRIVSLPYYPLFENEPGDVRLYDPPPNVYGILAAPPCEEFSFAKANPKSPRDLRKGFECVTACLNIIWECQLRGGLKFWAIENPVGHLRYFLGLAPYCFEQWEFGGNLRKRTEIWGHFNFPRKTHKIRPSTPNCQTIQKINGYDRKTVRAMTPRGFAEAFFKANL